VISSLYKPLLASFPGEDIAISALELAEEFERFEFPERVRLFLKFDNSLRLNYLQFFR